MRRLNRTVHQKIVLNGRCHSRREANIKETTVSGKGKPTSSHGLDAGKALLGKMTFSQSSSKPSDLTS